MKSTTTTTPKIATALALPDNAPTNVASLNSHLPAWLKIDFSNTPSRMRSWRNICIVLCGLFFASFMVYHAYLSHAFKTIGRDSAPSIVLAENIRFLLVDANSQAYLAAISKPNSEPRAEHMKEAKRLLDDVRERIVDASANITFGDEERIPLIKLLKYVGAYDQALGYATAHDFDATLMDAADNILQEQALIAASDLDNANDLHLNKAYSAHVNNALDTALPTLGLAAALLCFLFWSQIDLYRQTNRVLNKGYLSASFVCVFFFLISAFYTLTAESALRIAKKDAFDSVHALWLSKSVGYQAKSERAAMVLNASRPTEYSLHEKKLLKLSARIAPLNSAGIRDAVGNGRKFGGYLGDAFSNITFDGEKEALTEMAKGWAAYIENDSQNNPKAPAFTTSPNSSIDFSQAAFDTFARGLDKTLAINQKVFDQEVDIAMARLGLLPWLALAMLCLCVAGCYFGSKERLDEYRF